MLIYQAEQEAGLAEQIAGNTRASLQGELECSAATTAQLEHILQVASRTSASVHQEDLYYMRSILVTAGWDMDESRGVPAGWNRNDDFFDDFEVWSARASPEDKPVNDEHDCSVIVGHITANEPVRDDGSVILEGDELPSRFHLRTASVLYRTWDNPDLQKRVDDLLIEIARGQRFVSMECLFRGFDYCLLEKGQARAVARNARTAFLTRHLRAYGGDGTYQGQRVGRLLRNIVFSGKGLVKKPANPASVILPENASAGQTVATTCQEISQNLSSPGYTPVMKKEHSMSIDNEVQNQLVELRAENERLRSEIQASNVKEVTRARDSAIEELAAARKSVEELTEQLKKTGSDLANTQKSLGEHQSELKSALARIEVLEGEKTTARRIKKVMDDLLMTEEGASILVASLARLDDESFASAMQAWVSNKPQSGNTTFPAGTAATPDKSTSAPTAPQSTPAPAPMKGKADVAAPVATATATVTVVPDAALAVQPDAGAENIRQTIASYFGYSSN